MLNLSNIYKGTKYITRASNSSTKRSKDEKKKRSQNALMQIFGKLRLFIQSAKLMK